MGEPLGVILLRALILSLRDTLTSLERVVIILCLVWRVIGNGESGECMVSGKQGIPVAAPSEYGQTAAIGP